MRWPLPPFPPPNPLAFRRIYGYGPSLSEIGTYIALDLPVGALAATLGNKLRKLKNGEDKPG